MERIVMLGVSIAHAIKLDRF